MQRCCDTTLIEGPGCCFYLDLGANTETKIFTTFSAASDEDFIKRRNFRFSKWGASRQWGKFDEVLLNLQGLGYYSHMALKFCQLGLFLQALIEIHEMRKMGKSESLTHRGRDKTTDISQTMFIVFKSIFANEKCMFDSNFTDDGLLGSN